LHFDIDIAVSFQNVHANLATVALQAQIDCEISDSKICQLNPIDVFWKL
jgi:hypothetical protein